MMINRDTNELIITELATKAGGGTPAANGSDWIEVYNPGISDINLNGWYLENANQHEEPQGFYIEHDVFIPAGGHIMIMADDCDDGDDWNQETGCFDFDGNDLDYELGSDKNMYPDIPVEYIRVEFKLGKGCDDNDNNCNGEQITLYSPDGQIATQADYFSNDDGHPCDSGYSYARQNDSSDTWECRCGPNISFGFSNNGLSSDESACGADIKLYINEFMSRSYDIPILLNEWPSNTSGELNSESDYIEIYNPNASAVNLNGWKIDVGGDNPTIVQNVIIPPYGHLIAIANGCNVGDTYPINPVGCGDEGPIYYNSSNDCPEAPNGCSSYLHLPGKISSDESFEIIDPSGNVIDEISIPAHPCQSNCAYSRIYDGAGVSGELNGNYANPDEGWECRCEPGSDEVDDFGLPPTLTFGYSNGTPPPDIQVGDINQDGTINVIDVVALVEMILNGIPPEFDEALADLNQDGAVDVIDVVTLIEQILNPVLTSNQRNTLKHMVERLSTKGGGKPLSQCNDSIAFNYNPRGRGCNPLNRWDYSCCEYYKGNMRIIR